MPRAKKEGAPEPKKRSRTGCWPCKARKVKCGEEKPACVNCQRQGEACDYSIRLNWDGRSKRKETSVIGSQVISFNGAFNLALASSAEPPPVSHGSGRAGHGQDAIEDTNGRLQGDAVEHFARPPRPQPLSTPRRSTPLGVEHDRGSSGPMQTWTDPRNSVHSEVEAAAPIVPSPRLMPFLEPTHASPGDSQEISGLNRHESGYLPSRYHASRPTIMTLAEVAISPSNAAKRIRLSPTGNSFYQQYSETPGRLGSHDLREGDHAPRSPYTTITPTVLPHHVNNPQTPGASSTASDEFRSRWLPKSLIHPTVSDGEIRRVSVKSLLSASSAPEEMPNGETRYQSLDHTASPVQNRRYGPHRQRSSHSDTYGLDRGQPDWDIPKNNDVAAISVGTPSESDSDLDSWLDFDAIPEFAFGLQKRDTVFAKGGYYAQPVPIRIPRSFEPLPPMLLENPMNLLYFHHFLNHTAHYLVPHDCSDNPFKTILPKMALESSNLMNLLLSYSAAHRARLLSHPEPANRIAVWVRDVFPSLRHVLDDLSRSNTQISNANLATAIMLSSLEIISPSTFGVSIPWQNHLNVARQIIHARYTAPQSISRSDSVSYFLSRWFAYLDVLGSLSGRTNDIPLFNGDYWAHDEDEDYVIDCLLGMTPRCIYLLAQIASLARQCDNERISSSSGLADPGWKPSPSVLARAQSLSEDLEGARLHQTRPCPHQHGSVNSNPSSPLSPDLTSAFAYTSSSGWDALELLASNDSFHLAASIHLNRRILFLPRSHPIVQSLVHATIANLYKICEGGPAEACLLLPMFAAGCEALDQRERDFIMRRIRRMEEVGLMQVTAARKLMERVWAESDKARVNHETETEVAAGPNGSNGIDRRVNNIHDILGRDDHDLHDNDDDNDDKHVRSERRRKDEAEIRRGERGWEELLAGGEFFG